MLISDMVQEVLYEVPHAPHPLIETQLLRSAQDFCQRTRRWVVIGVSLTTVVDTSIYTVVPGTYTDEDGNDLPYRIIGIEKVEDDNDVEITAFTYNDGVITFNEKIYNRDETLALEVQLKPAETATAVYDPLFEDYSEGILSGAKYRMLRMRGVVWESQAGAKENKRLYDQHIHRCRTNKWNEDGSKELTRTLTGW